MKRSDDHSFMPVQLWSAAPRGNFLGCPSALLPAVKQAAGHCPGPGPTTLQAGPSPTPDAADHPQHP